MSGEINEKAEKKLQEEQKEILTKVPVYELLAYYYEPGEHSSGYQSQGFTGDKDIAQAFIKAVPRLDDRDYDKRPNRCNAYWGYKDEKGNLFTANQLEIYNKTLHIEPKTN